MVVLSKTDSIFCAKAWCGKCMSTTFMYQPKPLTDPLVMRCEVCKQDQNAMTSELITMCISESATLKQVRKSRKKKQ